MEDVMSETNQKPCILFFIPPAFENLDDFFEALEQAGYLICFVRYGKAENEVPESGLWEWIEQNCPNLQAVVWPGVDFLDGWCSDYIKNVDGGIHKIIAKLVKQGVAEVEASFDYGGAFDDTVVMYGSPADFAQEVITSIKRRKKRRAAKKKS